MSYIVNLETIAATWMLIFFHTICKIFRIAYIVILNGKIPNTFLCIVLNTTAKGKSYFTNAIPGYINNILYGCEDISHKENQAFFNEVHAFIKNSKRFIQ